MRPAAAPLAPCKPAQPSVRGMVCEVIRRPREGVQLTAQLQHGVSERRQKLTERQKQRLSRWHGEGRVVSGAQPMFEDACLVCADRLPERIVDSALQAAIVVDWDQ